MVLAVTIEVHMSIIIRPTYMYVHIYLHMEVISRHIRITGWVVCRCIGGYYGAENILGYSSETCNKATRGGMA